MEGQLLRCCSCTREHFSQHIEHQEQLVEVVENLPPERAQNRREGRDAVGPVSQLVHGILVPHVGEETDVPQITGRFD